MMQSGLTIGLKQHSHKLKVIVKKEKLITHAKSYMLS